jgi:hypothetical protein
VPGHFTHVKDFYADTIIPGMVVILLAAGKKSCGPRRTQKTQIKALFIIASESAAISEI